MYSTYLTASHSLKIPRLSPIAEWETTLHNRATLVATDAENIKTFYYKQVLDHFNYRPESYKTFHQRYLINFKYWGGANSSAPIFAYLGAESPIDDSPQGIGFLTDNAASFNALLVYIEHRYYGKSVPFGLREEAFKNASTIGYFNSAQAIADYAAVIIHIKKTLHAQKSPVIVIGGSYGGMLASWFRLKYPHLTIGALASSAPILYFDNITPQDGYYSVVTRDFREASETCYQTISKSWSEIDRVASQAKGSFHS
ncbi:Lysosomal Pro-X carboxypeptidase [Spatholobus suberectus]|nr:Lysosomal Pro-X carboxypeptidase [Spatholobus suberectus]